MVNVALLQMTGSSGDKEANLKKGAAFCRRAREMGADIETVNVRGDVGEQLADFRVRACALKGVDDPPERPLAARIGMVRSEKPAPACIGNDAVDGGLDLARRGFELGGVDTGGRKLAANARTKALHARLRP